MSKAHATSGIVLIACASFGSSPAWAADTPSTTDTVDASSERAEALATQARDETTRPGGDLKKAIGLYTEAYASAPAAILLFNLAVVHEQLHNGPEAISHYRRALAAGDLEEALAARAKERVLVLERASLEKPASIGGPPPTAPLVTAPITNDGWHPLRTTGVIAAGVGVLSFGVTGILAAMAKSKDDDANAFCDGDRCTDARAISLTDDARGLATAATVMFVTGAVLVAGGVVLFLVAPSSSSSSSTRAPSSASRALARGGIAW